MVELIRLLQGQTILWSKAERLKSFPIQLYKVEGKTTTVNNDRDT